tara:strand:+ start:4734 stop:5141 length:408 start_codon:yes stop_codon:yes gene_type:complete
MEPLGTEGFIRNRLKEIFLKLEQLQQKSSAQEFAKPILKKYGSALGLKDLPPSKQLYKIEEVIKHPYGPIDHLSDTPLISVEERALYICNLKTSPHAQDQALGNELEDTYKFYLGLAQTSKDAEEVLMTLLQMGG